MGESPTGWFVTVDWILDESNLLKILEGNYGNLKRIEAVSSCDWKLEPLQPNPIRDAEKAAIIATVKDPTWKTWCSRLAEGVRLNEMFLLSFQLKMSLTV
jgi:hypothetical protein